MAGQRLTIVTGAAGGLGVTVAERLLARGDRVWAVVRNGSRAKELEARFPDPSCSVRVADLTHSHEVDALFAAWDELEADARAVVHLAGGFRAGRLKDLSDEDWKYLVDVNLETTFRVFRSAARSFEQGSGGSLVAVSAPAALRGARALGAYSATKAGILRLVEALARELRPCGGRVNAILPGTMDTPGNREAMPESDPTTWVPTAQVSAVIEFLTSENAAAVNGAAILVPGPTL